MEKLLSVQDIMERYHLRCRQTAVKRMKEMGVRLDTRPYLVPESAVSAWEKRKEIRPPHRITAEERMQRRLKDA